MEHKIRMLVLALGISSIAPLHAWAVTINWAPVGNAGNAADGTGYGAVSYNYSIGRYDVTLGQYAEFLNAVAATDTYGLYNGNLGNDMTVAGITQTAGPGGYTYTVIGSPNRPVTYVNWGDAARFANWLQNGQPTGAEGPGTTETGAYTLNGAITDADLLAVTRNPSATVFLPSVDEWYKAAYYDPFFNAYHEYPFSADTTPISAAPGSTPNSGNFYSSLTGWAVTGSTTFDSSLNYLTDVGAYTASSSPYGAFDMGGDVFQWTEGVDVLNSSQRVMRGGSWIYDVSYLFSGSNASQLPSYGDYQNGFRVATIAFVPEPSTVTLAAFGLAALAAYGWRRRR